MCARRAIALAALAVLFVLSTAQTIATRRPPTYGLSSTLRSNWSWSGTIIPWLDDGLLWAIDGDGNNPSLAEIFRMVNADSGLTGTRCEMHFTCGANIYGLNALGTVTSDSTSKMTREQLQRLYFDTGICEVALHGANQNYLDPYVQSSGTATRATRPWADPGLNAAFVDSNSVQWQVKAGFWFIADSLGIPLRSYMTNGHRIDGISRYFIQNFFANCRTGTRFAASASQFPPDNADSNGVGWLPGVERGYQLEFSRTNLHPFPYVWSGYDDVAQGMWPLSAPIDRMNVPHMQGIDNLADLERAAALLAEMPATGVLVLHDQNRANPSNPPDLDGYAGVEEAVRYLAHYCLNDLLERDGPRLQVLSMDEAMAKHTSIAFLGGGFVGVPNIHLNPGDASATRPWGYAQCLTAANASLGWAYLDSAAARVTDGPFGYYDGTGVYVQNANDSTEAGTDTNFRKFVAIYQIPPGATAEFACFASTNRVVPTVPRDSLSACYIDIKVYPFSFDGDWSDSSATALADTTQPVADAGWANFPAVDPFVMPQSVSSMNFTTNTAVGYGEARVERRFHSRDGWLHQRTQTYAGSFYAGNTAPNAGNEYDLRWREFRLDGYQQPYDKHFVRVEYVPTGWTAAASDSLELLPIGPFVSTR